MKTSSDLKIHVQVMPTYAPRVNAIKWNPLSTRTNQKLQKFEAQYSLASYKHAPSGLQDGVRQLLIVLYQDDLSLVLSQVTII
jgi:hypothetical protein